jgi:hypothetical protein
VANLQRDIVQLIEFLNESPVPKTNSRKPDAKFVAMKDELDGINVKPEKGRRKDLRKIENVVKSLHKIAFSDKKND